MQLEEGGIFELRIMDILLCYYSKIPTGSFLKVSCNVKSATESMNFSNSVT